jgi:hypothetical protein
MTVASSFAQLLGLSVHQQRIGFAIGVFLMLFGAALFLRGCLRERRAALSPLGPAVKAVLEEMEYIRRRLGEWEADPVAAELSTPNLPATEWNKYKDLLRAKLDAHAYQLGFNLFDAIDRYNRERQHTVYPPDLRGLRQKLDSADSALRDQLP